MGQRVSLGQVRPKRRRVVRDAKDIPSSNAVLPTFDSEHLQMVSVENRRTLNEGLYITRGLEHTQHLQREVRSKPELSCVPEDSLPGMLQEDQEVMLEEA